MSYQDYLNHIVVLFMALFCGNIILRILRKCTCITWNKAVRRMYSLPYHTHRWILGPLTNKRRIKYQLFARVIKLLHSMKCEISNSIVTLLGNVYLAL